MFETGWQDRIALYLTGSRIMNCQLRVGCSGNSRYRRRDADVLTRICMDSYRCILFGRQSVRRGGTARQSPFAHMCKGRFLRYRKFRFPITQKHSVRMRPVRRGICTCVPARSRKESQSDSLFHYKRSGLWKCVARNNPSGIF